MLARRAVPVNHLIGPQTSQMIHSGNEALAASDVICHMIFFAPKQALKQWFSRFVVQGFEARIEASASHCHHYYIVLCLCPFHEKDNAML